MKTLHTITQSTEFILTEMNVVHGEEAEYAIYILDMPNQNDA
jgi:hypothetical protein